jgi:hypothetical protein
LVIEALIISALAVTACGPPPATPPVAHSAGSSTTGSSQTSALALAGRCLRQHGLANFPDPAVASSGPAQGRVILDKQALVAYPPAVVSQAMDACRTALDRAGISSGPNSGASPQEIQYLLAFARCVRDHGISNFPDPDSQGGFNLAGTGINSHQLTPAELAAARACLSRAHGDVNIPAQGDGTNNSG